MIDYNIIVVGGGPAGMMAAIQAGKRGARVLLLEKMPKLGRKLAITGKGRCNVTSSKKREEFFLNIRHNARFLYSSWAAFDNVATQDYFNHNGCLLKTERGDRVFPVSDQAEDVVDALIKGLVEAKVKVLTAAKVHKISHHSDRVSVDLDTASYSADSVIIATGGASYPGTGSTGDGYRFADEMGIELVKRRAALVPLVCEDGWIQASMGLSLRNVGFKIFDANGKAIYNDFGEIMCTHFGLSGPLVLSASGTVVDYQQKNNKTLYAEVDLKPALSEQQLDDRLQREIKTQAKKQLSNALKTLLPQSLVLPFLKLTSLNENAMMHSLKKEDRKQIIKLLKHMPCRILTPRPIAEAIVTAGGISVREILPKTMAIRSKPGVFVCGEVIDIDALTGGFNLQIAFSTGYSAGIGAYQYSQEKHKQG